MVNGQPDNTQPWTQPAQNPTGQLSTAEITPPTSVPGVTGVMPAAPPPPAPSVNLPATLPGPQPGPATPAPPDVPTDQPAQINVPPYGGPAQRGGPVKNALTRMLYGFSQAGMRAAGLPTDYEIQREKFAQALQTQQLQVQQAREQLLQHAQTYQEQQVPWTDPNTNYTYMVHPSQIGALSAASVRGQAGLAQQQLRNVGQMNIQQMRYLIENGQAAHLVPSTDANGNFVMIAYNKQMQPLGSVNGALPPASYMPKQSSGIQLVQDEFNVYHAVPKPTTTQPILPGGGTLKGSTTAAPNVPAAGGAIPLVSSAQFPGFYSAAPTAAPAAPGAGGAPPGWGVPAAGAAPVTATPATATAAAAAPAQPATVTPAARKRIPPGTPAAQTINASQVANAPTVTEGGGTPLRGPGAGRWMTWTEPSTNRQIAGSAAQAGQAGAADAAVLPSADVTDMIRARQAYQNYTKVGTGGPETWGVLQLINSLDKGSTDPKTGQKYLGGQLGVMASRLNSFMARDVGTTPNDDPRIIALLDKNHLGATKTMLAHIGKARSPDAVNMFLNMANAGTMDGPTLKNGTLAMADYMKDAGMIPSTTPGQTGGSGIQIDRDAQGRITGVR